MGIPKNDLSAGPAPAPAGAIDWEAGLERLRGAYSDRTVAESAAEFRRFEAWCLQRGEVPFPTSPPTIARYLDEQFPRYAARTLENRLSYIGYVHRAHRLADPTRHEEVRLAYRRGVRAYGARARQAAPLTAELRERLLAVCPQDTLLGLRDRAILSLGYDTLCRRSELVTLRFEDVELLPGGGAKILLRRSKTDPFSRGTYVFISKASLRVLDAWRVAAGLSTGWIIRPVNGGRVRDRQMHDRVVGDRLRALAIRADFEPSLIERLTAHSLRVGPAHDMAVAGLSLVQIMRAGRWRGLEAVALYVRDAPVNVWSLLADRSMGGEDGAGA